ncbi:MAG: DEAD/DEAH box helicase [Actinomycetota bacterium]
MSRQPTLSTTTRMRMRPTHRRLIDVTPDGWFRVSFPDDRRVADIVNGFAGRIYEPQTRDWLLPQRHAPQLVAFADAHRFELTARAQRSLGAAGPQRNGIANLLPGGHRITVVLGDRHDRDARQAIAELPTARWDQTGRRWELHPAAAAELIEIAERAGLQISPSIEQLPHVELDQSRPILTLDPSPNPDAPDSIVLRVHHPDSEELARVRPLLMETGARWAGQIWTLTPHTLARCLPVLEQIGQVVPHPKVARLIGRLNVIRERIALSSAMEATGPYATDPIPLAPGIEPRPYQRVALQYLDLVDRRAICGDETGLGKTIEACSAIAYFEAFPAVIVCRAKLTSMWEEALAQFMPAGLTVQRLHGETPHEFGMIRPDVVLISSAVLHAWWPTLARDLNPGAVIVDEAQDFKNERARRSKAIVSLARACRSGTLLMPMTGTPSEGKETDIAVPLDFIGRLDEFGGKSNLKSIPDLNAQLRATCYFRRTKKQVMPQLPGREYITRHVDGDPDRMDEYARAEHEFLDYVEERAAAIAVDLGDDPAEAAFNARMNSERAEMLAKINHLRRIAGQAKIAETAAWCRELQEENPDRKLLVFAHHHPVLHGIGDALGAPVVDGNTSHDDTAALVARFQEDPEFRILIMGITVGGAGWTLTESQDCVFVELPWTPGALDQALDRCYGRVNDPHGAQGHLFMVPGTFDERIAELLAEKRIVMDAVNDGRVDGDADQVAKSSVAGELISGLVRDAMKGGR